MSIMNAASPPCGSTPPPHAASDWTIPQAWHDYTAQDHQTWDILFARQSALLPGKAAPEFIAGLDILKLHRGGIPDFEILSEHLHKATGWQVVAVPGLVPDHVFFEHLANRRFVAGQFIRAPEALDYLQEPDIFHDVFGHVPLLTNPVFADYMQAYGEGGLRAGNLGVLHHLARLYWYTVEFGLIRREGELKIYGAGIVSSFGETQFSLRDPSPNRLSFNLPRIMRTPYRIDDFQQTYFVIDSFESLLDQTLKTDFKPLYEQLSREADLGIDEIIDGDIVITHGTQAYATNAARGAR